MVQVARGLRLAWVVVASLPSAFHAFLPASAPARPPAAVTPLSPGTRLGAFMPVRGRHPDMDARSAGSVPSVFVSSWTRKAPCSSPVVLFSLDRGDADTESPYANMTVDTKAVSRRLNEIYSKDVDPSQVHELEHASEGARDSRAVRVLIEEGNLLFMLTEGNRTLSESALRFLRNLWRNEQGPEAARKLEYIDVRMKREAGLDRIADDLKELRQAYPEWAEPCFRLALVSFVQGNYNRSVALCEESLMNKPWHEGAIRLLAECHKELGNRRLATHWSNRRLPGPSAPVQTSSGRVADRARLRWVKHFMPTLDARIDLIRATE